MRNKLIFLCFVLFIQSLYVDQKTLIDKRFAVGIETGIVALTYKGEWAGGYYASQYKLNFKNSYSTVPQIAVAMHKIAFQMSDNRYDIGYDLTKQQTGIRIFHGVFGPFTSIVTNSNFFFNYMATSHPDLESHQFFLRGRGGSNNNVSTFTSQWVLTSPTVSIGCYYQAVDDVWTISPSILNISYSINNKILSVTGYTNGNGIHERLWYIFYGSILIANNINNNRFVQGIYRIQSSSPENFQAFYYSPSIFFIGLRAYNSVFRNIFYLGFDIANKNIDNETKAYNQIDFTYFFVNDLENSDSIYLKTVTYNPHQSILDFEITGLSNFQQVSPTLDSNIQYLSCSSDIMSTKILSQIFAPLSLKIIAETATHSLTMRWKINITLISKVSLVDNVMSLEFNNHGIYLYVGNATFNDSRIVKKSLINDPIRTSTILLQYQKGVAGQLVTLQYKRELVDSIIHLNIIISVSLIQTSALSNTTTIGLNNIPYSDSTTHSRLTWKSNNIKQNTFSPVANGETRSIIEYALNAQSSEMVLTYVSDPVTKFQTTYTLRLMTISEISIQQGSNEFNITWMNLDNLLNLNQSQFTFSSSDLSAISSRVYQQFSQILVDASSYNDGDVFQMIYTSNKNSFRAVVKDLKLYKSIVQNTSSNINKNQFTITLKNVQNLTNSSYFNISLDSNKSSIVEIVVQTDFITILCAYFEQINQLLSFTYDTDTTTILKHKIKVKFQDSQALSLCPQSETLKSRAQTIWMMSVTISGLYLFTFLLSIFCCKKMLGIELIYLIQLSFYSLIPVDVSCDPFRGLSGLKYSSGLSPVFEELEQTSILKNYLSLGIQANFLSNVNVLILPAFILPLFYFPINKIGEKSNDIHTKPRCKRYGKSLLCEVPLTILLFNSFAMNTSFIVNIQAFKGSNYFVVTISALTPFLLPFASLLFLRYKKHFKQFRDEFQDYFSVHVFDRIAATKIRRFYTFILIWEFILVPIMLAIQDMFSKGLYLILVLQIAITVFVFVFPLYPLLVQNIRNYVHRFVVLLIVVTQIVALNFKNNDVYLEKLRTFHPFILLSLLLIGFLTTGMFTIWKSIQFIRSRKLTDGILKIRLTAQTQKPVQNQTQEKKIEPRFAPRSQFTPFRAGLLWQHISPKNRMKQINLNEEQNQQQNQQNVFMEIQNNNYDYVQKFVNWFQDIGTKQLWKELNLDQQDYERFRLSNPNKYQIEIYICELFHYIEIYQLMVDYHDSLISIEDMMDMLEKCKKVTFKAQYQRYFKY